MGKWFDANGVDVDAYPDRAFKGGVYDGGVFGRPYNTKKFVEKRDDSGQDEAVKVNADKADDSKGATD